MNAIRDSFADLEKHRVKLEQNVAKLRSSLQLWQAWEIEYEGMKEEILGLRPRHTQADLLALGHLIDADGLFAGQKTLLTPHERRQILLDGNGTPRNSTQVLDLLSRRIDYTQQNVKSVSKLLEVAEQKLTASQVLIQPEVRNEEGLPLTEIHEELDDDGNIISSSTSRLGEKTQGMTEALRKAGIQLPVGSEPPTETLHKSMENPTKTTVSNGVASSELLANHIESRAEAQPLSSCPSKPSHHDNDRRPSKPKKSVSFANGTKEATKPLSVEDIDNSALSQSSSRRKTDDHNHRTSITDKGIPAKKPTISHPDQSDTPLNNNVYNPIIPDDESPEDAALRRQMIQYNMDELGAVVAELEIDDDENYSEDYSEEEHNDYSSVDEDEDQYGRTKACVLDDKYLAEMEALQKKLRNIGPDPGEANSSQSNHVKKTQLPQGGITTNGAASESKPPEKKGVRFANEIDLQEALLPPDPAPISNNNLDRSSKLSATPILASIVERPYTASPASPTTATEPDEYDAGLIKKEVATEYHKMRNRMIARQGGFRAPEEGDEVPLTEAEGGPKKMSRFKAARLGRV